MLKNLLKFLGAGLGIVALAIGAISGVQYLKYRYSPEYKAEREIKNLIKAYEEDPYGGDTPEETLRLFVDALKKGDTDLASKYFVMEKQEKWRGDLKIGKEKGNLPKLIDIVSRAGYGKEITSNVYLFSVVNEKKEGEYSIELRRTKKSYKWKIESL